MEWRWNHKLKNFKVVSPLEGPYLFCVRIVNGFLFLFQKFAFSFKVKSNCQIINAKLLLESFKRFFQSDGMNCKRDKLRSGAESSGATTMLVIWTAKFCFDKLLLPSSPLGLAFKIPVYMFKKLLQFPISKAVNIVTSNT